MSEINETVETMDENVETIETVETAVEAAEETAGEQVAAETENETEAVVEAESVEASEEAVEAEAEEPNTDDELFDKANRAARLLRARRAVMGREAVARAARMEDLKRALKLLELKPKMEQKEMADLLGMRLRELDALLAEAEAADIVARVEPADEPDMRKVVVYTGEDAVARVGVLAKKQDKLVPSLDDEETEQLLALLSKVIDPELGRSVTDLGMIAAIEAAPASSDAGTYDVTVHVELTVPGCPLSETITSQINGAVSSYPGAQLLPHIEVGSMSRDKLADLVADLKAERKQNPFSKPGVKTRIFAIASGKGGVGKSSVTANLAATFAALGFDTAAIDADIYGFSLPRLFGVHTQPTNLNGMLMPVTAWGVKLISIGMFAGADRAILWRGPRLQRSLEQFLSDVWWGEPDVLLLDLAPGTGDMAISVAQALPNAELVVVTTPQPSASDIAVRSGLVALQVPMKVRGVVENMSYYEHKGEKLEIFGAGGGQRVSEQLTQALGYDVPLMAQLPLEPEVRETGEAGRPAVLDADGALRTDGIGQTFRGLAERLLAV